jgi:hypothetical protein
LAGAVFLLDSITQVDNSHTGCVVVTGSHGGVSAARFALDVRAALYVFNDAGGGKDMAGVAGLDLLEADSIAAICVSHDSARIGEALDTFENGVISAINPSAERLGLKTGEPLRLALERTGL